MSEYLRVANWKKHQHRDLADKGNMPWLKLESGIFDDAAIAGLNAYEFRAYIRALTLAARTGNKLVAEPNWLRAHFGRSWFPVCSRLVSLSLLEGTIPPQKALQKRTTDRATDAPSPTPRREERREDKKNRSLDGPLDVARTRVEVDGWEIKDGLAEVVELDPKRRLLGSVFERVVEDEERRTG